MDNTVRKTSDPAGPISAVGDKSNLLRQSAIYVEGDETSKAGSLLKAIRGTGAKKFRDPNLHTEKEISYINKENW